tara:strand:- start:179 stop:430 length:252 start_codon:yes stop_codon:yes gene_type:complete
MKQVIMMSKEGCATCTEFGPVAKKLAEERGFEFKVIKNPEMELPFFPYYYLMHDGNVVEEWGGGSDKKFIRVLDRALKKFAEE